MKRRIAACRPDRASKSFALHGNDFGFHFRLKFTANFRNRIADNTGNTRREDKNNIRMQCLICLQDRIPQLGFTAMNDFVLAKVRREPPGIQSLVAAAKHLPQTIKNVQPERGAYAPHRSMNHQGGIFNRQQRQNAVKLFAYGRLVKGSFLFFSNIYSEHH